MPAATTAAALLAWVAVAARTTGLPFLLAVVVILGVLLLACLTYLRGR
jgi:hypothetical protein